MSQSLLPPLGSLWLAREATELRPEPDGRWPHRDGTRTVVRRGDLLLVVETSLPFLRVAVRGSLGWVFWGWLSHNGTRIA